ncbi:MAG: Rieske (2Fe-2S) protein [Acidimicrobiales bacterium]|nr:Rieske (2Fe-2S) protein [Acidimicrobiales bacterium]
MKVVVSSVKDFPDGERRMVEVNGRSVGVFRRGDSFYALRNQCPHQGGPLCIGAIAAWPVSSGPGDFGMDESVMLLACPWHGWEYDLATGQSFLGPGNPRARQYQVSVTSGRALIGESGAGGEEPENPVPAENPAPAENPVLAGSPVPPDSPAIRAGLVPGPYVAETVPVSVEEEYVVIDA